MSLVISLRMKLPIFFIIQASHSKNGSQRQVIRYDPNIYADAPNQSLTLSVNGPLEWVVNLALYATAQGRFNQGPRGRNREVMHYISNAFEVTPISLFFLRTFNLLPPANEVCEGYVFTRVCLSTGGVVSQYALQVSRPTPRGRLRGLAGGGVSRPTPRGQIEQSGWGFSRPTPKGEVEGSGWGGGIRAHTRAEDKGSGQGGLQAHNWGVYHSMYWGRHPLPQQTATAVGGKHPTGMHSRLDWCSQYNLVRFELNSHIKAK